MLNKSDKENIIFAFFQVSIIFANYLSTLNKEKNHFHMNWESSDIIPLIALHLLFIIIFAFAFKLIKKQWLRSMIPLYYLIGYAAFFTNLKLWIVIVLCLLISIKPIYELAKIESFKEKASSAMLAMSIIFVLSQYMGAMSTKNFPETKNYSNDNPTSGELAAKLPKNIFFLVFDRLSYQELYLEHPGKELEINSRFKNFKTFSDKAWNFHASFSPYDHTQKSIPSILFRELDTSLPPITDFFKDKAYQTHLLGNYIDYCGLITNASSCKSYKWYKLDSPYPEFLTKMSRHLFYILISGESTLKKFFLRPFKCMLANRQKIMMSGITSDLDKLIETNNEAKFVYAHIPVPHPPYSFNKDGARSKKEIKKQIKNKLRKRFSKDDYRELYLDNLDYADKFLGNFIKDLKEKNLYDNSLIIITADHSYQKDPKFPGVWNDPQALKYWERKAPKLETKEKEYLASILSSTHIPLIVKLAKERKRRDNFKLITNSRLFSDNNELVFDRSIALNQDRISKLAEDKIFVEPQISNPRNYKKPKKKESFFFTR